MSLRLKLGLSVVLFVTAVLAAAGLWHLRAERDIYLEEMRARSVTLLKALAIPCAVAMANGDTPTLDNYVAEIAGNGPQLDIDYLMVVDVEGRVVAHTDSAQFGRRYDDAFALRAIAESGVTMEFAERLLHVAVPVVSGLRWGTLRAGFSLRRMDAALRGRQRELWLTALAVTFGGALVAYAALSWLVVRPVFRMRAMAQRFGAGDLKARVELPNNDEMGQLADGLNGMAQAIEAYTGSLEGLVKERTAELNNANERLRDANERLDRLARTDALTGLYNRRHVFERLQFEVRRGERHAQRFVLMMIDVDHFKAYNDAHGHQAGDALLQRLAAVLEGNLRATDLVGRYGGEEFIVVLLDTGAQEGMATAEKLRAVVEGQAFASDALPGGRLTISIGVAFYPDDGSSAAELIARADEALYGAKAKGRNRVSRHQERRFSA